MFQIYPSDAQTTGWPSPVELPLRVLFALRGRGRDPETRFNLVGALGTLLAHGGAEGAVKVVLPFIFAPEFDDGVLTNFVEGPLANGTPSPPVGNIADLRVETFPGLDTPDTDSNRKFDIVHFAGGSHRSDGRPDLAFDRSATLRIGPGALCDALIEASCRLLVIQSAESDFSAFDQLADLVVRAGGPTVLCATARSPVAADSFLFQFYAGVVHSDPLSSATRLDSPELIASLRLGKGGDKALDLSEFLAATRDRLERLGAGPDPAARFRQQLESFQNYGHRAQIQAASERIGLASTRMAEVRLAATEALNRLDQLPPSPWDRETSGILPLAEIANLTRGLNDDTSLSDRLLDGLEDDLRATNAPRVLNANFTDPDARVLGAREALVADREYNLLVDVGPRWSQMTSLVSGANEFPIAALPPDHDGYKIAVVFVSEEFQPQTVSGAFWLPGRTGGSRPIIDGEPTAVPAPIKLRLRAPGLDPGIDQRLLHGRLCLYYENNLLQSAKVTVTLAAAPSEIATANEIVVDYLLTGAFRGIGDLLMRNVTPTRPTASAEPVAINFTLNEDGSGTHRIVVGEDGQTAWFHYDPIGANRLLEEVRAALGDCYWRRDDSGNVARDREGNPSLALDAENGKPRTSFMWDLLKLARLGSRLFGLLFDAVAPPAGQTAAQWRSALRGTLAESKVIQVARTGPAQYVFPWALVYDLSLPNPDAAEFCPVLEDWGEDGRRPDAELRTSCPHAGEALHTRDNLICPYGFWGFRHRIEQPPSLPSPQGAKPPVEPVRHITAQKSLSLSVALTGDADLDQALIAGHLRKLSGMPRLTFAPPPAEDWDAVCTLLRAPNMIYFLCHGDVDPQEGPYLGIGARDAQPRHRVYAQSLSQFFTGVGGIDPDEWARKAPLVIINGCHTTNLTPGQMLNFVAPFTQAGASGVIGTEISVLLKVAVPVAEMLFASLAAEEPVADAIRSMRWTLMNRGNLLGLAYTPYCFADLRVSFTSG
jgi:hypothetical protein